MLSLEQKRKILKERKKNREKSNIVMTESGIHVESFKGLPKDTIIEFSKGTFNKFIQDTK